MKKLYLIIALLVVTFCASAQVKQYFIVYISTGIYDHKLEQEILKTYSPSKLYKSLEPYFTDTLVQVRQQAYYLSYKTGLWAEQFDQQQAVHILLGGCDESAETISGNCLSYLKAYPKAAFDSSSIESLKHLLQKSKTEPFRELYLLAGYVGVGKGIIQQQLLDRDRYNNSQRWLMHLALARMGNQKSLNYCISMADKMADDQDKVAYLVPDLIYTRQKRAIDYCVEILNSNQEDCISPNADIDTKILCGYRVLELLTPVINDFPIKTGPAGSLLVNDYEEALYRARDWFCEHPDYTINQDTF